MASRIVAATPAGAAILWRTPGGQLRAAALPPTPSPHLYDIARQEAERRHAEDVCELEQDIEEYCRWLYELRRNTLELGRPPGPEEEGN